MDNYSQRIEQHRRWSVLGELQCFPCERNHRTPSISTRSCTDTSGKSARLSLRASDITSSSELEHSKTASGLMERRARDLARMDLELPLNLVRAETRPTSNASSRHPSRTANANAMPFSDASVQMQTSSQRKLQSLRRRHKIPPHALCSMRTVDHGSPETKTTPART